MALAPMSYPLSRYSEGSSEGRAKMAPRGTINPGSVSGCCSSSSASVIIIGKHHSPSSSSRSPGVAPVQYIMATMDISSSPPPDGPSRLTSLTHTTSNHDVVTLSQVLLAVRATTISPSSTDKSRDTTALRLDSPKTTMQSSFSSTQFTHLYAESTTASTHAYGHWPTDRSRKSHPTSTSSILLSVPCSISSATLATASSSTAATLSVASTATQTQYTPTTIVTPSPTAIVSGASSPSVPLVGTTSNIPLSITSEWTSGGHTYETTTTLESANPNNVHPTATPGPEPSNLPTILGPVLGVFFPVALGILFWKCCNSRRRAARRAQSTTQPPMSNYGDHRWLLRDTTPPVATPALLAEQIHTPPPVRTRPEWQSSKYHFQADDSSQISEGQTVASDPFANGSSMASPSQTTVPIYTPNNHSVETVSTRMYPGAGSEVLDGSHSTHDTAGSSELNLVAPVPSGATSTYSVCFSPTGHYRGRPLLLEEKSLEQSGDNALHPHMLGTTLQAAGARLRALLDEARRK